MLEVIELIFKAYNVISNVDSKFELDSVIEHNGGTVKTAGRFTVYVKNLVSEWYVIG